MTQIDKFTHPSADQIINSQELNETVNRFGSFFTMLTDKPISCVTFFLLLEKTDEIKTCISTIADVSWYELVDYLSQRYTVLNKSKKIKNEPSLPKF
jgi:putative flippase GtrA